MMNEFEYYLIENDNNITSPLLVNNDDADGSGTAFLDDMEAIDNDVVTHLIFNPPIPNNPQMTDYLWLESRAVFSKKVYDVLKNIDIKDFQLVPAIIKGKNREEYSDYWIANIYREFAFLDKEKSKYARINSDGEMSMIKSMVINKELMLEIPLAERLIYICKEGFGYVFYHKSIVDLIMSVNPTGLVFIPVDKWYNGISYSM